MVTKFENGACITAVLMPKSGVTVTTSGCNDDVRTAFGALCLELLREGKLSFMDMRSCVYSAFLTHSPLTSSRSKPRQV